MSIIIGWLAFLRFLKPWHVLLGAFAVWTGIVGVKAYRAGGKAVIETARIEGKKNEAKAAKAHDRARAPGAAERLREHACRDCR